MQYSAFRSGLRLAAIGLLCGMLIGGCKAKVEVTTPRCGDGQLDTGEQCDDGNTADGDGCSSTCQTETPNLCGNGTIDGSEMCDDGNTAGGDGCSPACTTEVCGNGTLDATEQCEDGNVVGGDGCSPVCLREECGNGYTDAAVLEECDDSNTVAHDGCSDDCLTETIQWLEQTPATSPALRYSMGVAANTSNGNVVVFGGGSNGGGRLNDLWVWNGTNWAEIIPLSAAPSTRASVGMAYYASLDTMVVFGGYDVSSVPNAETWEFDGDWSQISPFSSPTARGGVGMVYDSAGDVIVLFGGLVPSTNTAYNETWEYDGTDWLQVTTATAPSARQGVGMVFDSVRNVTVLFGGANGDVSAFTGDTWEYDGFDWTAMSPATSPAARFIPGMTFDTHRGVTVLFGGRYGANTEVYNDTWEYDGTNWTQTSPTGPPVARYGMAVQYHPGSNLVLGFGGVGGAAPTYYNDTWYYGYEI